MIIIKSAKEIEKMRQAGIEVTLNPSRNTVFFENIYGENQNERKQRVLAKADPFTIRQLEHVEAARAMGASDARIMFRYILPLCVSPIIVRLTLIMALTVINEASLTFLGVGLLPDIPSWGTIVSEAR